MNDKCTRTSNANTNENATPTPKQHRGSNDAMAPKYNFKHNDLEINYVSILH